MTAPMKAKDFTPCLCCGKGVMHAGAPMFLRVRIDYLGVKADAVRRRHGEELLTGPLAGVLGLDEDLTQELGTGTGLICASCMVDPYALTVPFALFEKASAG